MSYFDIIGEAGQVRHRAHKVCFDFVMQELELGMSLCRIVQSDHSELAKQHRMDADKAYRTALRFAETMELNKEERAAFNKQERKLRQMLEELSSGAN